MASILESYSVFLVVSHVYRGSADISKVDFFFSVNLSFFQNLEIQVKLFFPPLQLYQLINVLSNHPFYKSFTKHFYVLFHLSALTFALIRLEG